MISIQISNLSEVIKRFKDSPQIVSNELEKAIKLSATLIQRNAKINASKGVTGQLRSNINIDYAPERATIHPDVNYASYVELGTGPHFISISVLQPWADLKGINVYALRNSIAKKGTQAHPFMSKAADDSVDEVQSFFEKAVTAIANTI